MTRSATRLALTLIGLNLMMAGGCAKHSRPTNFYLLQPLAAPGAEAGYPPSLGVGPIKLAPYLDRPQIVTAVSSSRLKLAEFDRWAEPLQDSFSRTLSENLSTLLASEQVVNYPWPKPLNPEYQVEMEVGKFHVTTNGQCELQAQWSIRQGQKVLLLRNSAIRTSADSGDYEAVVTAQSKALELLSREIAEALKKLNRE